MKRCSSSVVSSSSLFFKFQSEFDEDTGEKTTRNTFTGYFCNGRKEYGCRVTTTGLGYCTVRLKFEVIEMLRLWKVTTKTRAHKRGTYRFSAFHKKKRLFSARCSSTSIVVNPSLIIQNASHRLFNYYVVVES